MKKILKNPSCYSTVIHGNEVILNTDTGSYHELNHTGSFIWNHIKNGVSKDDVLKNIIENFNINQNDANLELDNFLQSSIDRGLIFYGE